MTFRATQTLPFSCPMLLFLPQWQMIRFHSHSLLFGGVLFLASLPGFHCRYYRSYTQLHRAHAKLAHLKCAVQPYTDTHTRSLTYAKTFFDLIGRETLTHTDTDGHTRMVEFSIASFSTPNAFLNARS
uniref:Uncharacterized protein n=1 Tax=Anopheles quadriannulatus TaxID=34691 RepID=A0A182XTZ7_ANOQN